MDREYTVRFSFAHKALEQAEAEKFEAMFVAFDEIASRGSRQIHRRLGKSGWKNMHTSRSKVLDNAVVGWILGSKKRAKG
ncbi:hypothetical protein ACFL6C_01210 [Myxococcota bacterium]